MSSISKSIATFITYPILTLRVRFQCLKTDYTWRELLKIVSEGNLYAGLSAKFIHTVLNNACMLTLFEEIKHLIKYLIL